MSIKLSETDASFRARVQRQMQAEDAAKKPDAAWKMPSPPSCEKLNKWDSENAAAPRKFKLASGTVTEAAPKRIRQRTKPLMNKLEAAYFEVLKLKLLALPNATIIRAQAKTYVIANGMRYSPDFSCSSWPVAGEPNRETCWEVKGPHAFDGALDKLKMAATVWPEVRWILVWKEKGTGRWLEQIVRP